VSEHRDKARKAIEERRAFKEQWFEVRCLIPVEVRAVWEETRHRFHQLGITHPDEAIENGMMLEYACAEWLLNPGQSLEEEE
jgi:hypothetical protein